MKIVMIGTGYVGLVTGACLAEFGHNVTCIDKDEAKIDNLKRGEVPFYEPGLAGLVAENIRHGRLFFDTNPGSAIAAADAVFIAVGTPSQAGDGQADLSFFNVAVREIAAALDGFTVVVTKSTVPVGTGDRIEQLIESTRPDAEFAIVSNPEFLREGSAIEDFQQPDRVVIGADSDRARAVMAALYAPLEAGGTPIVYTDRRTSELIKYAANAFLATKITFINEMADICEAAGGDVEDLARGIGLDPRIGTRFLKAGPGIGGSCFPKDTLALAWTAAAMKAPFTIVESMIEANNNRKKRMADKVAAACGGLAGKTLAVLGLSFKPETDDMREAPSLIIVPELQRRGARIRAFDPAAMTEAVGHLENVDYATDALACIAGADALVVMTEWEQFRLLDPAQIKSAMSGNVVVDLRNIYDPEEMQAQGFNYHSVGRAARLQT
jgi:UDPglucose 6-dehydrogenase